MPSFRGDKISSYQGDLEPEQCQLLTINPYPNYVWRGNIQYFQNSKILSSQYSKLKKKLKATINNLLK